MKCVLFENLEAVSVFVYALFVRLANWAKIWVLALPSKKITFSFFASTVLFSNTEGVVNVCINIWLCAWV
jgi:hypothetical protein